MTAIRNHWARISGQDVTELLVSVRNGTVKVAADIRDTRNVKLYAAFRHDDSTFPPAPIFRPPVYVPGLGNPFMRQIVARMPAFRKALHKARVEDAVRRGVEQQKPTAETSKKRRRKRIR